MRAAAWLVIWGAVSAPSCHAVADESAPTEESPNTVRARALFVTAGELASKAAWAEALAAFEQSYALRPHPVTRFNVGASQRALGRYSVARASLQGAIAESTASAPLPYELHQDALGYIAQIDTILVRLSARLSPAPMRVLVDGRPLVPERPGASTYLAGVAPPGRGTQMTSGRFEVVLDPGPHVFTLSREGYADAVVNRTFEPGARVTMNLQLELLPATLHVDANVPGALVFIDGRDAGPVPVELLRPEGVYTVVVEKPGHDRFENVLRVRAGQRAQLSAKLVPTRVTLTDRWWFWAGAAAVLTGGAVATYALTRSEPGPPPYQTGNTGWLAEPIRW